MEKKVESLCGLNSICHGLQVTRAAEMLGSNRKGFLMMEQLLSSEALRHMRCYRTWLSPFTKDQKNLVEGFYITEEKESSETNCGTFGDFSDMGSHNPICLCLYQFADMPYFQDGT